MNSESKNEFVEYDEVGETTLDVMSKANKFNRWMYKTIKPYCKNDIFEIGSGLGNISEFFLTDNCRIQLSDLRQGYCNRLKQQYSNNPSLLGVDCVDLIDNEFDTKFSSHFNKYNTVFALNVIEHIDNDLLALENCKKLLLNGGKLIVLVPSYLKLYNQFDTGLGHCRRYNKDSLAKVFNEAGYEIIHKQYFNFVGIFGWFFSGSVLKKQSIPEGQMGLYNLLVPIFKMIDKLILNSMGLSIIIVGEKKEV